MPAGQIDFINKQIKLTSDRAFLNSLLKDFSSISFNSNNQLINIDGWEFSQQVLLDICDEYKYYVETMEKFIDFFELNNFDNKINKIRRQTADEEYERRKQERDLLEKQKNEENEKLSTIKIVNLDKK